MKVHLKTKYTDTEVILTGNLYAADPMKKACRINAIDSETGEPISTLTTFLAAVTPKLPEDYVVVKNYSENEGMARAMVNAGLGEIEQTSGSEDDGFLIFKITNQELLNLMKETRQTVTV
jgi:hypothetical protein